MKILSNLKIKDITGFVEFYESIGFKKLSDFKTNNEIVNATFEYNDNLFKIFKTNKIIKQSMSFHFNKDEKKDVEKLMSLFIKNGGKVTCDIEESAAGHFFAQYEDKFGVRWNFAKYDYDKTKLLNIYSSQLPSLLQLGFTNVYQREQRELNYFGNFAKEFELFNTVKFFKYHDANIKGDYVVVDKLDMQYNPKVMTLAPKHIEINYGWDEAGQNLTPITGNSNYTWKLRNDLYKQYNALVNSLFKEGLIDRDIAIKLGKEQLKINTNAIEDAKKSFAQYKGKTIGFVYHWPSKAHYFDAKDYDPEKIVLMAPSILPFVYDDFSFNFPDINDKEWINESYNKYGIVDWETNKTIDQFENKFDILIYANNEYIKLGKKQINKLRLKSMLKNNGEFRITSYQDIVSPAKSLFGIKAFIKNLKEVL